MAREFPPSAENILMHELNGMQTRIVKSTDKSKVGMNGRILWESKKMLEIETEKGMKKIQKRGNVFEFDFEGRKARIDGRIIEARPEDRIKAFAKKLRKG